MSRDRMTVELSRHDLRAFCESVMPAPSAAQLTQINEAVFGLSRMLPFLQRLQPATSRVLEVGAGSLMLSTYLASRGFDVTALEPMSDEFECFVDLARPLREAAQRARAPLTLLQQSIDDFDVTQAFDLVFSINALEHMAEPFRAIDVMSAAVRPGGRLVIHCPNYDVPFDSHFGIVLLSLSKRFNALVYHRRVASRPGIWDGLSFVRLSRVRRHCATRGYDIVFNRHTLHDAVARLRDDVIFAERMPWFLRRLCRGLLYPPIAALLTRVPVRFQSPMEFVMYKAPGPS